MADAAAEDPGAGPDARESVLQPRRERRFVPHAPRRRADMLHHQWPEPHSSSQAINNTILYVWIARIRYAQALEDARRSITKASVVLKL